MISRRMQREPKNEEPKLFGKLKHRSYFRPFNIICNIQPYVLLLNAIRIVTQHQTSRKVLNFLPSITRYFSFETMAIFTAR